MLNTIHSFCRNCDLTSKETYLAWADNWKLYYDGLTKLSRTLKNHRNFKNFQKTYEAVSFVPVDQTEKWSWDQYYKKDIKSYHYYIHSNIQTNLQMLNQTANMMLEYRKHMKKASWARKCLDRQLESA